MKINGFADVGKTNPILSASLSIVAFLPPVALAKGGAKMEAFLPSIALAKEGAKADFKPGDSGHTSTFCFCELEEQILESSN